MPLNLPPPKASTSAAPSLNSSSSSVAPAPSASTALNLPSSSEGATPASTSSLGSSNGIKLPPPKTKAKSAASGPKKFVLDLPKPSRENDETSTSASEPAAKRARTNGSGLETLLPEPSKPSSNGLAGLKLPEPKSSTGGSTPTGSKPAASATSLLPHALKGKGKASTAAHEQRAKELREADQAKQASTHAEQPAEPALDFFGLGESDHSLARPPRLISNVLSLDRIS